MSTEVPLSGIAKVLAGGSAVTTGVFAALGLQDDGIERIVREEPNAVLVFGGMIALGIAAGVVASLVEVPGSVRMWWVAPLVVLTIWLYPTVAKLAREHDVQPEIGTNNLAIILGATALLGVVFVAVTGPLRLSMNGAMLVFGGVIFALGTYGAVRLAIDTKTSTTTPDIESASIARADDGLLHLKASVEVSDLRDCAELVVTAGDVELWRGRGGADAKAKATIDTVLTDELVGEPSNALPRVRLSADLAESECSSKAEGREIKQLIPIPVSASAPMVSATLTEAQLQLTIKGAAGSGQNSVRVTALSRRGNECKRLAVGDFPVGQFGTIETVLPVSVSPTPSEVLVIAEFMDELADGRTAAPVAATCAVPDGATLITVPVPAPAK